MARVFSLNIHADYQCRHSGVCCSSDWDVPVDLPVYRNLEAALHGRRVIPAGLPHDGTASLIVEDDLPEDAAAMLARTESGHCVFYHRPSGLCVVHRELGHDALPATCRHFPRVAVQDDRGIFISLSHYCPTAASLLFREMPIEIVADPRAFPPAEYEGLVVKEDDWPPLLKPQMLMDLESYGEWERHMVRRCSDERSSPEGVVATLKRDAGLLVNFDPLHERLFECVSALRLDPLDAGAPAALDQSLREFAIVMAAVPDDLRPDADEDGLDAAYGRYVRDEWPAWSGPLRRYLAAKAFANWTAYQGQGVMAIVRGLEAALALVRVEAARQCRDSQRTLDEEQLREAIRSADFALNHLAVGEDLADAWSR